MSDANNGSTDNENTSGNRGWFGGTLDVISNAAARATTPTPRDRPGVPLQQQRSSSPSAIHRLPSQDSLDRSMHNDSGHGNKSAAQVIRDLKKANARLTAQTASMEADYMNQLNQATLGFQKQQSEWQDTVKQKEAYLVNLEQRLKHTESRLKENNDSMSKMREESAFQRHTISDLRTQLHQLEDELADGGGGEKGQNGSGGGALSSVSLDFWKDKVKKIEADKQTLQEQIQRLTANKTDLPSDETALKQSLKRSESALADLKRQHNEAATIHMRKVSKLEKELKSQQSRHELREHDLQAQIELLETQQGYNGQLEERDGTIVKLRQQVLDYSSQLTALTSELTKLKTEAERQEEYRRDEADDLRVLHDAQEDEIDKLRKQLEEALHEIEMRDHELEEKERELRAAQLPAAAADKESAVVAQLQQELDQTKAELEEQILSLQEYMEELITERDELRTHLQNGIDDKTLEEAGQVARLNHSVASLEHQLSKSKESAKLAENAKQRLAAEHEVSLSGLHRKFDGMGSPPGEPSDSERMQPLLQEMEALKRELSDSRQSPGAIEDELRKRLKRSQETEQRLRTELGSIHKYKNAEQREIADEVVELRQKLSDRDTTISALVKSSVSLEQQITDLKFETNVLTAKMADQSGEDMNVPSPSRSLDIDANESLAHYKRAEEKLSQEVFRLKKQLRRARNENDTLRTQLASDKVRSIVDEDINNTSKSNGGSPQRSPSATARQLKERDEAIARLVRQSMNQDVMVRDMQHKLFSLTQELDFHKSRPPVVSIQTPPQSPAKSQDEGVDIDASPKPSWEEVQELRKETEMYAGQVIELDDEIEALRTVIADREKRIQSLEAEVAALRGAAVAANNRTIKSDTSDFEAEIDELKEANEYQRNELRELRQTAREFKSSSDQLSTAKREAYDAQQQTASLQQTLEKLTAQKTELEREIRSVHVRSQERELGDGSVGKLEEKDRRIEELKTKVAEMEAAKQSAERALATQAAMPKSKGDEMEFESLREERDNLQQTLDNQSASMDTARNTIRELEQMLAERTSADAFAFEEEKEELLAEIELLTNQLDEARQQLKELEDERHLINDFKAKLEQADDAREESERSIVDNYERKLSLLTLDKDVTIDKLRKDLSAEKEAGAETIQELDGCINKYESALANLRAEMRTQIEHREGRIQNLEATLEAQEQLVNNMKAEMDHLQGSMETSVVGRREEIDDMQQELVDLTSTAARQERELTAMRMQLEEKDVKHQLEIEKLQKHITSLESQSSDSVERRSVVDSQMEMRVNEVKDRLEKLKYRNETLHEENKALRERLGQAETKLQRESSAVRPAEYQRQVKQLEDQLVRKDKHVEDLESELARYAAKAAAVTRAAPSIPMSPADAPGSSEVVRNARSSPKAPQKKGFGFLKRSAKSASYDAGDEK